MLQPIMHLLSRKNIILASGSPRRKQIIENVGLKVDIIPSTFEENLDKGSFESPSAYALETSKNKALEVARRSEIVSMCPDLIIGADTVLEMDGNIYEKPKDADDALKTLSSFCGREHTVCTGVTLVAFNNRTSDGDPYEIIQFSEKTKVKFGIHSQKTLQAYIETGEPFDKAGGYGIQAAGGTLIEGIVGDYFNVMGFPLYQFAKRLCMLYGEN